VNHQQMRGSSGVLYNDIKPCPHVFLRYWDGSVFVYILLSRHAQKHLPSIKKFKIISKKTCI